MAQASTQAQLAAATGALDPDIKITADVKSAQFSNCEFTGNHADSGGGLYLSLQNVEPFSLGVENTGFTGNVASTNGGAITLGEGEISAVLDSVVVKESVAGTDGGGLYSALGTGRIAIQGDSRFEGNLASASGGGVYHGGDRVLALTNAVIDQNTGGPGQGVYNDGPLELGPVAVVPDRLYLPDQDAIPAIVEHLSGGSVVQLEGSSYVTPNQTGTPIVVARSGLELVGEDAAAFRTPPTGFAGWRFRVSDDSHQILLTPVGYHLYYENTLGVENPNPAGYTVVTSTITLLPLANTPGNLFLGWYDAAEGGNLVTDIPRGSTGDKLLYARWQVVEYTVTYYGNDAGGPTAEHVPLSQQVQGGERVTLSDERPTRAGYAFINWNTRPDGTGTPYQPGQTVGPFYADLTIHAQWQRVEHILTYHGNDESGPPAQWIPFPQPAPEGIIISLPDVIPTREGYRFTGWNTQSDGGGTAYRPGDTIPDVRTDIDLYAQWIPLPPTDCYTLTYCGNDAGGPPARCVPCPQQIQAGGYAEIPCCAPYRAYYCFIGWNSDPCGRGQVYCPGENIGPATGDVRLYAQWKRRCFLK